MFLYLDYPARPFFFTCSSLDFAAIVLSRDHGVSFGGKQQVE